LDILHHMGKGERNDRIRAGMADFIATILTKKRVIEIVDQWNARLKAREEPFFMPTIRCAIFAKKPWLLIDCESCGLMIDLDLRVKPRPAEATVLMAFRDVRCPRCNGHGRPMIKGLAEGPRG
jgi:hypothetical protein